MPKLQMPLLAIALLALFVNCMVFMLLPTVHIDEMRYVSVAWEMWRDHQFIVPHLDGIAYHHKPPLFFWLIHASWWLFGVNDFTPRLIPLLFMIGSVSIVYKICLALWPTSPKIGEYAGFMFAMCLPMVLWSSLVMFDVLLVFWVLLANFSVIKLLQGHNAWKYILILSIAIAGGILTKGPVAFLHIFGVVVFSFWWFPGAKSKRVFFQFLFSFFIGSAIAALWVVPAAMLGGEEYRHAILWGQTANRMVNSFAHQRPIWWYLPLIFIYLFPWLFISHIWHRGENEKIAWRLSVVWFGSAFLLLSLISGKQFHYLLPDLAPVMILFAYRLHSAENLVGSRQVFLTLIWTFLIFFIPLTLIIVGKKQGVTLLDCWPMILLALFWAGVYLRKKWRSLDELLMVAGISVVTFSIMLLFQLLPFAKIYDLEPIQEKIAELQVQGITVAHVGFKYRDYDFLFKVQKPIKLLVSPKQQKAFIANHPKAVLIKYSTEKPIPTKQVLYSQPYRQGYVFLESITLG